MRSLLALALLVATSAVAQAKPSNPAFLGVSMADLTPSGPCAIESVTRGSAADDAGIRSGDSMVSIDKAFIGTCDMLLAAIQKHRPNDKIVATVERNGVQVRLKAQLWPRDEVLRRRGVIGQTPAGTLTRIGDASTLDLGTEVHASIIGWYSPRCSGCAMVFTKVARWAREYNAKHPSIDVLAAVGLSPYGQGETDPQTALKGLAAALPVPLYYADFDTYDHNALTDADRVYFMVVDCRGVVQHLAPVMPDDDDTAAALDELYAAAEQSAHVR